MPARSRPAESRRSRGHGPWSWFVRRRCPIPYTIESLCPKCGRGEEFSIGNWPEHLGVFACPSCKALVNVPLETGHCAGCGTQPGTYDFYDYAHSIAYMRAQPPGEGEPGPPCPKCAGAALTFNMTSHYNVGRLGEPPDGATPWAGRDYLEKAIFFFALVGVAAQWKLPVPDLLAYYHLDMPDPKSPDARLYSDRRLSMPILFDIRNHLLARVMVGELPFPPSEEMRAEVDQRMAKIGIPTGGRTKRWWQFWK
jgi:hypothetical protein